MPDEVTVLTSRDLEIGGRPATWFELEGSSTAPERLEACFDALERALAGHGLTLADVVRSRMTAATREGRAAASAVRLRRLSVPFPCATSSYIDPSAFAGSDGIRLATLAVRRAGLDKTAIAHDPSPPPWKFVATGDLAFLSGITSPADGFDAQLPEIRARVLATLAMAEQRIGRPIRPTTVSAYVGRSIALETAGDLAARVGLAGTPIAVRRCDGFASPASLIEIEIDAAPGD
ncbi:MAG TPA: hypothetical protein VFR14_08365 [Candidatus Limnocylindrales bacterium]|nr:hypothetical protein [Candidatus Limnocylindrales bacterium]